MARVLDYAIAAAPAQAVQGGVKCPCRIPRKEEIAAWPAAAP